MAYWDRLDVSVKGGASSSWNLFSGLLLDVSRPGALTRLCVHLSPFWLVQMVKHLGFSTALAVEWMNY